jgi:hypothetical protein
MGLAVKGYFKYNFWTFLTEPFAHSTSFTSNTRTFKPTIWTYKLIEQYQPPNTSSVHLRAYSTHTSKYIEHELKPT